MIKARPALIIAFDDLQFSLELEVFNLDVSRRIKKGRFSFVPTDAHEGADFVIGVGQTIPHLSEKA